MCFKTFGAGKLLGDSDGYGKPSARTGLPRLSVADGLRYTLTVDPDVALLGLSNDQEQDAALAAFASFAPCTPEELVDLRARAAEAVKDKGRVWWNP